ncbi:hypothetical protein [Streptomyces sp. NPDC005181]
MVHETWDLVTPAAGYAAFLDRWSAYSDGAARRTPTHSRSNCTC